jgi:anti-sigma-K factor RskA
VKTEERHAQLELCIPYVFGRLNPGNRKQFEAHLASGCEQCSRELSELYEATALLPLLLRQETPPGGLRQRMTSRLSSRRAEPQPVSKPAPQRGSKAAPQRGPVEPAISKPATPHSWYFYASIVTGAILIVALLLFLNDQLRATSDLQKKLGDLQVQVQQRQEMMNILQAQKIEMLQLSGVEAGGEAFGRVFWEPEKGRAVVQAVNLPAESADKQYQLWLVKDNKYVRAGEFDVAAGKSTVFAVMTLPVGDKQQIDGFEVTLEPRGGSTQPSGTVRLRGTLR